MASIRYTYIYDAVVYGIVYAVHMQPSNGKLGRPRFHVGVRAGTAVAERYRLVGSIGSPTLVDASPRPPPPPTRGTRRPVRGGGRIGIRARDGVVRRGRPPPVNFRPGRSASSCRPPRGPSATTVRLQCPPPPPPPSDADGAIDLEHTSFGAVSRSLPRPDAVSP